MAELTVNRGPVSFCRYLADHCALARFTRSAYEKIPERYQAHGAGMGELGALRSGHWAKAKAIDGRKQWKVEALHGRYFWGS